MTLRELIEAKGYTLPSADYYAKIDHWRAWYKGFVKEFHKYTIQNKGKPIERTRASLNVAKLGAEYWADLLWNNLCSINLENEKDESGNPVQDAEGNPVKNTDDEMLQNALEANDFTRQLTQLVERAFAVSTGAMVVYNDGDSSRIDYIEAECIFPLTVRNGEAESCAFVGRYNVQKKAMAYIMWHEKQEDGSYQITNAFYEVDSSGGIGKQIPTPSSIAETYNSPTQRFAIVRPNIANNIERTGMGISIYANAEDAMKNIDLAFDGIKVSMEIGRPRIGVSANMLQVDTKDGRTYEIFDANDIAVYVMGNGTSTGDVDVKDLTAEYRAEQFETSLEKQMQVYSQNIGLGDQAFRWDASARTLRTATEVVASNSAMQRAMVKHQEGIRSAIKIVARALLDVMGLNYDQEVVVVFDDSVTKDRNAEASAAWQWVASGRFPFWAYLVKYQGYDEKEAKRLDMSYSEEPPPTPPTEEGGSVDEQDNVDDEDDDEQE